MPLAGPTDGFIGDIYARVTADIRPIKSDLKKLQDEMEKIKAKGAEATQQSAKSFEGMYKAVRKVANAMTTAFRILLAFKAAAAAARAVWESILSEARAEEIRNKFDRTFKSIGKHAETLAQKLAKDFDLADSTAKGLIATTGDLLVGFGFLESQALELSERANRLALDLVSFQNIEGGAEYAADALTKAMLGNTRQAKQLGIVIRQDTEEFRQAVQRLMEMNGWTVQQAKAVAILNEAYKQSPNAVGDYARTQEELMNQVRRSGEEWKKYKEAWGQALDESGATQGWNRFLKEQGEGVKNLAESWKAVGKNVDGSTDKVVAFGEAAMGPLFKLTAALKHNILYEAKIRPMIEEHDKLIAKAQAHSAARAAKRAAEKQRQIQEEQALAKITQEIEDEVLKNKEEAEKVQLRINLLQEKMNVETKKTISLEDQLKEIQEQAAAARKEAADTGLVGAPYLLMIEKALGLEIKAERTRREIMAKTKKSRMDLANAEERFFLQFATQQEKELLLRNKLLKIEKELSKELTDRKRNALMEERLNILTEMDAVQQRMQDRETMTQFAGAAVFGSAEGNAVQFQTREVEKNTSSQVKLSEQILDVLKDISRKRESDTPIEL